MTPAETFYVVKTIVTSSLEAIRNEEDKMLMRWHLTCEKNEYFYLLTTFLKSYLNTTLRKKRSILKHLHSIDFDFSKYVDKSFKTFMTAFVPINVALDIMMVFLVEGVKVMFRYTYAIIKMQKEFIKDLQNPESFLEEL